MSISVVEGSVYHCITFVTAYLSVKMALTKQSAVRFPSYKAKEYMDIWQESPRKTATKPQPA